MRKRTLILIFIAGVLLQFSISDIKGHNKRVLPQQNENNVDKEINKYVPSGYSQLMQKTGDLNLDGIADIILILKRNGEDSLSTVETPIKRKLLILIGNADKSYSMIVQNDNIVYYYNYDANFKDAFVDMSIEPGLFSIDHYGGFFHRWGRTTTFKYDKSDKNWYLYEDVISDFEATDQEKTLKEKKYTAKNFGKIAFEKFDIYKEY